VKNVYGTEEEAWALNGLEEPLKKKYIYSKRYLQILLVY
jgi:hypothetical protein